MNDDKKVPLPPGVQADPTEPTYYQNKAGTVFRVENDGMVELEPPPNRCDADHAVGEPRIWEGDPPTGGFPEPTPTHQPPAGGNGVQ